MLQIRYVKVEDREFCIVLTDTYGSIGKQI